eukprot:g1493.t1
MSSKSKEERDTEDDASAPLSAATASVDVTFVILGATGDLARKKLYPGLASLIAQNRLSERTHVVGYGRRAKEVNAFLKKQCVSVRQTETWQRDTFYPLCSYFDGEGSYTEEKTYRKLDTYLSSLRARGGGADNRIFFLALPPHLFGPVTRLLSIACKSKTGFTRVIIEKPFGHDSGSFRILNDQTSAAFDENSLYRIDHYLGKEVIMTLLTLRFSNTIFSPLWNCKFIESVHINWKEDLNTAGRAGYFDKSGIIRDVLQNHLLQVMALLTMERPSSLNTVADAKRDVLKCVSPIDKKDCVTGQFTASKFIVDGKIINEPGYLDDADVPSDSCTPTYGMVRMFVDNNRWRGVPFLLSAGKGLDERLCEVRIRFKPAIPIAGSSKRPKLEKNELVIRIQPDESIYFKINAKHPGLSFDPTSVALNLSYRTRFADSRFSDAYEVCLLNCVRGDRSLFVGADELTEAWRIFTPLLHAIDDGELKPETYEFGSNAPKGAQEMAHRVLGDALLPSWHALLCDHATTDVTSLRAVFKKVDKDNSGFVDEDELFEVLSSFCGRSMPRTLLRKCMRHFDMNRDGKVDFDEFSKCVPYLSNRKSRAKGGTSAGDNKA